MNLNKIVIEKDLWYIDNFLTQEEIDWIMSEANKESGWYITMQSPYGNIGNKYLQIKQEDENGNVLLPTEPGAEFRPIPYFYGEGGILERIESVMPEGTRAAPTLQSFLSRVDDSKGLYDDADFALDWHYENYRWENLADNDPKDVRLKASYSLYINNNFDGGDLIFKYKDYVIKPMPGRFVNIPITKEFTHKVTKVTNGDRHTLYGSCWEGTFPESTRENC